jgi:FKBP-type peptidyl-prolyl cis-trans isomerase SlyD
MQIQRDCVVTLIYSLRDETGDLLEEVVAEEPFVYLHGHETILPGLEAALNDLGPGNSFHVVLDPEEAFGAYEAQYQKRISRDEFPSDMVLKSGMAFELVPEESEQAELMGQAGAGLVFYVKEVGEQDVLVDANHPLAGRELHFSGVILEVRPATKRERDEGNAHIQGP